MLLLKLKNIDDLILGYAEGRFRLFSSLSSSADLFQIGDEKTITPNLLRTPSELLYHCPTFVKKYPKVFLMNLILTLETLTQLEKISLIEILKKGWEPFTKWLNVILKNYSLPTIKTEDVQDICMHVDITKVFPSDDNILYFQSEDKELYLPYIECTNYKNTQHVLYTALRAHLYNLGNYTTDNINEYVQKYNLDISTVTCQRGVTLFYKNLDTQAVGILNSLLAEISGANLSLDTFMNMLSNRDLVTTYKEEDKVILSMPSFIFDNIFTCRGLIHTIQAFDYIEVEVLETQEKVRFEVTTSKSNISYQLSWIYFTECLRNTELLAGKFIKVADTEASCYIKVI